MERIFKKGIDIKVALSSGLKNLSVDENKQTRLIVKDNSLMSNRIKNISPLGVSLVSGFVKSTCRFFGYKVRHLFSGHLTRMLSEVLLNQKELHFQTISAIQAHQNWLEYKLALKNQNNVTAMSRKGVIVIGAGGHAKVCIELLHEMGNKVDYCIGGLESPNLCLNIPVLKGDDHLTRLRNEGYEKVFVAIGDNSLRLKLANHAVKEGYQLINAVSPHAFISDSVNIGLGIAVMAGVIINAQCKIDDLAIINTGATVDHDCQIGQGVHIAPQCGLAGNVVVEERGFVGIGTKIIPNTLIGADAIIGAGSVVIGDIPSNVTAVGAPAKIVKNNVAVQHKIETSTFDQL